MALTKDFKNTIKEQQMISERKNAHAVIRNMLEIFTLLVQSSRDKNAEIKNTNDSLRYYSGSDFFIFNGLFSNANAIEKPHQHFSELMEFFSLRNKSFTWWWTEQTPIPESIQKELDHFGFESLGNYLGIAADLSVVVPEPPPQNISIKEVETDQEYQLLMDIIAEVFQFSPSVKLDYEAMCKSYGKNGYLKHYLGYYDHQPVSTLTTYSNHHTAGFYNGATLPHMQKHGLCSALARHAVIDAKNAGNTIGISQLMAPGMAKGLSEKMGFKTNCILLPFVKHLGSAGG